MPRERAVVVAWQACAVVLALAAGVSRAAAQAPDAPVLRLTLDEARRRALAASHRLAEADAREAAARAAVASREALDRPIVSAQAGYLRTNHILEFVVPSPTGAPRVLYPDVPDNYRTRLDLQWPIYSGGRVDALARAAAAEARAVAAEVATARADLRLDVARAYWALVTARATVDVVSRGVERARAHVADARARTTAGLVPPNELASAEAQEARQRMLLIDARNQRDLASADLARLVGAAAAQGIEPASALDEDIRPAQALDALVAEGLGARGERQALTFRVDAARAQRDVALAGRRPTVAIGAGADYASPNPRIFPRARRWDDSWDAGVNVSWSLWDGGRTAADAAQASSLADAARQRLAEFDSVLALEVRQRTLEIDSGRAAVAAAAEAIRAAAEARRIVTERYRVGVIAQSEVLDAEIALLQAELDRTRALAGVRLAEARLDRAAGR